MPNGKTRYSSHRQPFQPADDHPKTTEGAYCAAGLNAGHLPIDIPPLSTHRKTYASDMGISCKAHIQHCGRTHHLEVLLRKEVIQPHLPVRLPCYDLVPIAGPTFDGSLPQGVRPPASGVTDFHDVTGGVYKARERIHRSVADLRLLATPTSWGRVADPNPN